MSATNRGKRGGQGRDFFATPIWCTRAIVRALDGHVNRDAWWLEPACGDGAIERILTEEFKIEKVIATDIQPGPRYGGRFDYAHELDYLAPLKGAGPSQLQNHFEVAITNPPYSLAFDFVQRMVVDARVAVALLPMGFLASKKRRDWLRKNPPNLYVLSDRPSFCVSMKCRDCGFTEQLPSDQGYSVCPSCGSSNVRRTTTDAIDYAWFCFGLPPQPIQFLSKEGGAP